MKKLLFLFSLVFILASCACQHKKVEPAPQVDSTIVVDKVIKADLDYMTAKYGDKDFRWYESLVLLEDFLDSDADMKVAELVNVYQVAEGGDTHVYKIQHLPGSEAVVDSIKGFWIEDFPMNYDEIKLSYDDAFAAFNAVNFPRPHSKHICLRKPIGPQACNSQYVFGNIQSQVWIDAVTGEAKNSNPAFPDGFKMPLGEWP